MKTNNTFMQWTLVVLTLILLSSGSFYQNAHAQDKSPIQFGIQGDAIMIAEEFNAIDDSYFFVGGTAYLQFNISDKLGVTFTSGYQHNLASQGNGGLSFGLIPLQGGIKFYPTKSFFLGAEVGGHIFRATLAGESATETYFSFAPGLGFSGDNFEIGARYQAINLGDNLTSFIGLRFGIKLPK